MAIREKSQTDLKPFLGGSALVHVGLAFVLAALLVPASVPAVDPGLRKPEDKVVREEPKADPEEVKALEQDKTELSKLVREEVAREQLRPLFDKLTAGELKPDDLELLWAELQMDLDPDLQDLAELLQEAEFDPVQFNMQASKLREMLLRKLEERLRANEAKAREQNLAKQAQAIAKNLAENLKKALQEQVGKPVGDALNQTAQADQVEAQKTLAKAALELTAAAKSARQAEAALQTSRQNLEQAQRDLEAAEAKKDAKAQTQAQTRTRAEQAKLAAAQRQLDLGKTQAQAAAQKLQDRHPEIAGPASEAAKKLESTSKETVAKAASEAGMAKPGMAAPEAKKAQESAGQAGEKLEKLAQAAQIQAAREQIGQARRDAQQAARTPDAKQSAEAGKQAEKAETTAKAVAAQLEQTKQEGAARDVKAAAEKLQQGKAELAAKNPAAAKKPLEEAQARLDSADAQLRREQEKLGVQPANATEAALARLDEVRRNELAKMVEEKLQPLLDQKLQAALQKQPMAQGSIAKQVKEELQKLDPGKVVADAAGERLPMAKDAAGVKEASKAPHAKTQGDKGQAAAQAQLDRLLGPATEGSVKSALAQAGPPGSSELLRRLAVLKNSGTSQGSGLLDLHNGEGGEGLRARVKSVQDSKGWGRGLFEDAAAYKRMKEFIQDRERLVGDVVGRQAAEGSVSQAKNEAGLKPAFVGVPSLTAPEEKPVGTTRKVAEPTFKTHRFAGIPLLPDDAITLDGDLTDWKDLPTLTLLPVIKGTETKVKFRPKEQIAYLAWTRRGLLLAFDVEDTTGAIEDVTALSNFWLYDCVEIYIDTLNTKSPNRGEAHTHQFFVFPFGPKDSDRTGFEAFIQGDQVRIVPYTKPVLQRAAQKTARGWTMEVLISSDLLRQADLVPGRITGFNLQIDTGSDLYYYWTASEKFRTSMHPNTWGDLQMLGSDARVTFLDDNGKKSPEGLVPGKPLRVQVNDPDMNLNREGKDRVGLTLRTAAGETRTMVLEETAADSGIFEGTLATALNIGGGAATVLPVFEGETLTAEYLDQVRAYGERNQKVTARLPVAALGTRFDR